MYCLVYGSLMSFDKGSRKKVFFLVDSPLRPLAPPPSACGQKELPPKKSIKKVIFSFVNNPLPPPPLKKEIF